MLSRLVLLAGALSAAAQAGDRSSLSLFPDQAKSLAQLSRQALDRQIRAAITGKQPELMKNPLFLADAQTWTPNAPLSPDRGARSACSIPLGKVHVPQPYRLDPMAQPMGSVTFDRMAKPAAVPACKN